MQISDENWPASTIPGRTVVAKTLHDLGIRNIFGVMGDSNLGWLTEWALMPGSQYVPARHESGAVSMADGFALETGGIGISTTTYGPGLLNAMNSLATATRGGRPNILITGSTPRSKPFHLQRYDQAALVTALGAEYRPIIRGQDLEQDLRKAVRDSYERRTTIVIDFADEALYEDLPIDREWTDEVPEGPARTGSPLNLDEIIGVLRDARRPVVLAGYGIEVAGARQDVTHLAEAWDAKLANTLMTRGMFSGSDRYLGVFGGFSTPAARCLIEEADVLLVLGASLNEYTADNGRLLDGKRIVHIDRDSSVPGREFACEIAHTGDAGELARALVKRSKEFAPDGPRPWQSNTTPDPTFVVPDADESDDTGIDPRVAMALLDAWLPDDRVVVVDGGHFIEWPCRYLRAPAPGSFRVTTAGGSIALAMAQTVGMAHAGRVSAYVAVVGDGSFFMSPEELETAVRESVPLVLVVVNDRAYSAEVHKLHAMDVPVHTAVFDGAPDIAEIARAFGADAITIRNISDASLLPPIPTERPLVIDVQVTRTVVSSRLRALETQIAR
jgi:thiamine pyrophosphate-dependent acetolactate synthase large subunit-like protein